MEESKLLEKKWSNRCINCKFIPVTKEEYVCNNKKSKRYKEVIEFPSQTNCELWRYRY